LQRARILLRARSKGQDLDSGNAEKLTFDSLSLESYWHDKKLKFFGVGYKIQNLGNRSASSLSIPKVRPASVKRIMSARTISD